MKKSGRLRWTEVADARRHQARNSVLLMGLFLWLTGTRLYAAEQEAQPITPELILGWENFAQVTFGLIAVIGIIVFLTYLIKRFSLLPGTASGIIKILGGLALNNKDRLILVQVGDEQILLSASPGRIGKIHVLQTPVDTAALDTANGSDAKPFSGLLNQMIHRSS